MRARLAALLLLAGLLLCAACGGGEQQTGSAAEVGNTETVGTEEEAAPGVARVDTRRCPGGAAGVLAEPLDLAGVTVDTDRPAEEARAIREGIAAVVRYSEYLGIDAPKPLQVHSYRNYFETHLHLNRHGGMRWPEDLARYGFATNAVITDAAGSNRYQGRIWLGRGDRVLTAIAVSHYVYSAAHKRREIDLGRVGPIVVRGLTTHFAYHALECAGFGSVADRLAADTAVWRDSGQGWLDDVVASALVSGDEDSSADNLERALGGRDTWSGFSTTRLIGMLAIEQIGLDPQDVWHSIRVTDRRPASGVLVPKLVIWDPAVFEADLRRTGILQSRVHPIEITVQWTVNSRDNEMWLCERSYWTGQMIRGEHDDLSRCFRARRTHHSTRVVLVSPGTYDWILKVGDLYFFAGALAITPTNFGLATPDSLSPSFDISIQDRTLRIRSLPAFVKVDVPYQGVDLCHWRETFVWCWHRSSRDYALPEGRYTLLGLSWPPALVEISTSDARVIGQHGSDEASSPEQIAFERIDGGWRVAGGCGGGGDGLMGLWRALGAGAPPVAARQPPA